MRTLHRAVIIAALIGAAASIFHVTYPRAAVRAQAGCSVENLFGTYAYTSSGYYGLPQGLGFFAAAGRLTFNGDGTFSGIDTASTNGTIQRNRATTGTYTVGSDCRGTVLYKTPGESAVDFVLSDAGHTASFIQANTGTVVSGTARLLILPPVPQDPQPSTDPQQ